MRPNKGSTIAGRGKRPKAIEVTRPRTRGQEKDPAMTAGEDSKGQDSVRMKDSNVALRSIIIYEKLTQSQGGCLVNQHHDNSKFEQGESPN